MKSLNGFRIGQGNNQKSMLLVVLKTTASSSHDGAFSALGNGEDKTLGDKNYAIHYQKSSGVCPVLLGRHGSRLSGYCCGRPGCR